ncbi:MAG TPA: hypothetical protein VF940_21275 [Streptosporangiaceae bacterium]
MQDRERGRPGERLHVGGSQDAGVLGDDGCGGAVGQLVEVALHRGPYVLPVLHEIPRRVDAGERFPRARFDIRDVLLVQHDVVAGAQPTEVSSDEVLRRVGQRRGRGLDVAGDVLAEVEVVDGYPAGVDDVDEHQRVVVREVDVDVVRRVVGSAPGQLGALIRDLQGAAVGEGSLRRRAGRVVVAQQQPPGLLVPDPACSR